MLVQWTTRQLRPNLLYTQAVWDAKFEYQISIYYKYHILFLGNTQVNERGWSKKEPGEQFPKERTHIFEQMIFHALAEEYIGESKAAELMNLSLESLRSMRAMESQDVATHQ